MFYVLCCHIVIYVLCLVYCLLCTVVGMRGKGTFGPLYVCTYIGLTIKLSDSDSEEVWQPGLQRRLHSQRFPLCHEEPWHRLRGSVPLYGQSEWVFNIDKRGEEEYRFKSLSDVIWWKVGKSWFTECRFIHQVVIQLCSRLRLQGFKAEFSV